MKIDENTRCSMALRDFLDGKPAPKEGCVAIICSALDKEKPKDCIVHEITNGIFLECPKCGYWQKEKALKFYCPNCGQRIK